MSRWPMMALGDVLRHRKGFIEIDDGTIYTRCRVQVDVRGIVKRDALTGSEIKTKRQQVCKANDFLVAEIDAKHGGFGIVSDALHGAIVSSHYFLFETYPDCISHAYLGYCIKQKSFIEQVAAQGSTNYAAIRPDHVLGYRIPLPPLAEQQAIVTRLDALAEKGERLTAHWQAIADDAATLLAVRFAELIADAPRRPLGEIAPLLRRPIVIDDAQSYTELGIKSFYKGAFRRRTVSGSEFTWQKMFAVKEGDLMFSNIMAWEQAIAVAGPEHAGCITNHRMLLCDVNRTIADPSFLWFYFTTAQGFTGITAASPGTAARNKTLNPEALQAIPVPLPPLAQQQAFNQLQTKVASLLAEQAAQREQLEQLRKQALEQAFT